MMTIMMMTMIWKATCSRINATLFNATWQCLHPNHFWRWWWWWRWWQGWWWRQWYRQCHRLSFYLERRSQWPPECDCRKCMALKKYLQDHRSSWKRLSALLCPSTLHCSLYCCFKFIAVAAGATFVNCLLLISRIWMIYALLPYRFTHFVCSFFRLKISFANYLHLECMVRLIWCLHFYHLALINITTK